MKVESREFKRNDYVYLHKEIKDGTHGFSRIVKDRIDGKEYYLKFIDISLDFYKNFNGITNKILEPFKKEHENLITIIDYYYYESDFDRYQLIVKTIHDPELKSLYDIYVKDKKELELGDMLSYLIDVFGGLKYLNESNITCYNIKPENILIKGKHAYITDYYLSNIIDLWDLILKGIYDSRFSNYLTPEMWKGVVQSSISNEYRNLFKVDVFSTVLSFYSVYNKNLLISNLSKMMAFDKTFKFEKIFITTNIDWLDRLVEKSLTPLYQERGFVVDIYNFLDDIKSSKLDIIKKIEEEMNNEEMIFQKEKMNEFEINKNEENTFEELNIEDKIEDKIEEEGEFNTFKDINIINGKNIDLNTLNNKKLEINEFENIGKPFNVHFNSKFCSEKILVVLIGKKFKKEYKNVKVIDFDQSKLSSMDDYPTIENFVENFDNIRFILLNIDDDEQLPVKVNKAFNYLTKLVATNKDKNFIILSYWSLVHNESMEKYVKKQLDTCEKYQNSIYISSAGNQGINFTKEDSSSKYARFPTTFIHNLKLSIGSLESNDVISKTSNKGYFVDYYSLGNYLIIK